MKRSFFRVMKAAALVGIAALLLASCMQPTGSTIESRDYSGKYVSPVSPTPTVLPYEPLAPLPPEWDPNGVYVTGDLVTYEGAVWQPRWWTQGQAPSDIPWSSPWEKIADLAAVTVVLDSLLYYDDMFHFHVGNNSYSFTLLDAAGYPLANHPVKVKGYPHMTDDQGRVDLVEFIYENHPGRIYYTTITVDYSGGSKDGIYYNKKAEKYDVKVVTGWIPPTITPTPGITITPTPTSEPVYPEWVTGTVDPQNGDLFTYQGHLFEAQNNPGMWENPVIGGNWFWIDLGVLH